ncbi:MAG: winged helix-turn-helix domain-containing protein [Dehalococcoidia bacterium]|nr:winged helix-turn-helix domain-containing protein [Dehalococcoidia bacterium]
MVNLGLFVIDLGRTGGTWFFYPLLGWGLFLALHWFLARSQATGLPPGVDSAGARRTNATGLEPATAHNAVSGSEGAAAASPIAVDVVMRTVRVDDQLIDLTPKEFDLLVLFAQNPGRPFSRDELLDRLWKNEYEVTDRTVDTHVQRLRKKLGPHGEAIQTVWGVGYRFQAGVGV